MKIIFILLLISFPIAVLSQQIVRGNIFDKTSGEPLQFAVISQNGRATSATSDKDGYFQLTIPASVDSLNISIIGYRPLKVAVAHIKKLLVVQMNRGPVDLQSVTITPQSNNATFQTLSAIDLHIRPINSAQDLMRLVPGLFLGQHHGGGIAEHLFLRGFDADHGTDVNVSVDDMPLNLV
jgi:hypothetical protein